VHLRAGIPSVLRTIVVGLDLEFTDRVDIHTGADFRGPICVVVNTIQEKLVFSLMSAGNLKPTAIANLRVGPRRIRARNDIGKLRKITAIQRQRNDFARFDDDADTGTVRLDDWRLAFHIDDFRDVTHSQRKVSTDTRVDTDIDTISHLLPESRKVRFDL